MPDASGQNLPSIEDLRAQIDIINDDLIRLISSRAQLAAEIGHIKTLEGRPHHYDPAREERQLKYIEEVNPGPFTAAALKSIFKEIFRASLDLEEANDKKQLLVSRKVQSADTVLDIKGVRIGRRRRRSSSPGRAASKVSNRWRVPPRSWREKASRFCAAALTNRAPVLTAFRAWASTA
ncbi:MAG: chorismate mutase [Hymenobacter sp.]